MKEKIIYIVIIVLLILSFIGINIFYFYKFQSKIDLKTEYECTKENVSDTYQEKDIYKIYIEKDYSIKEIQYKTIYTYSKENFENIKQYFENDDTNIVDEKNYTITVKRDIEEEKYGTWAKEYVENLQKNEYTCVIK